VGPFRSEVFMSPSSRFSLAFFILIAGILAGATPLAAQHDRPASGLRDGRTIALSNSLKRTIAAELRSTRGDADAAATNLLNSIAERTAARLAASQAGEEQVQAAQDGLEQLVATAMQASASRQGAPAGAPAGAPRRGPTISTADVNQALRGFCPFYPIC